MMGLGCETGGQVRKKGVVEVGLLDEGLGDKRWPILAGDERRDGVAWGVVAAMVEGYEQTHTHTHTSLACTQV